MRRTKRSESGFAMLLVFAMAATVGIMLYMELPRLVFESQRIKEQDLISRGEEYKRGIQLYVRKFKKYPASIDDLEKGTEVRFIRRRYTDPMTGKDEWRLVHIDNMGFFTDSLIHKAKEEEEEGSENTFITEGAAFGSTGPPPGMEDNTRTGAGIRGASDRPVAQVNQYRGTAPIPGQAGGPPLPGQIQPGQPGQPMQPQQYQPGGQYPQPGQNLQPGQYPVQGQYPPGQQPPYPQPGVQAQYPAQGVPGLPGPYGQQQQQPGQPVPNPNYPIGLNRPMAPGAQIQPSFNTQNPLANQQPGVSPYPPQGVPGLPGPYGQQQQGPTPNPNYPVGLNRSMAPQPQSPYPNPSQQARPGFGTPGNAPGSPIGGAANPRAGQAGGGNAALGMIQQILTTPRPGGLSGMGGNQQAAAGGIPGGIAGVATTVEAEGIMIYNERSKYQEWEFLYNYSEEQQNAAQSAARGAGMGGANNPLGQGGPGGQSQRQGSAFGGQSSFGRGQGSSSFGQGQGTGSSFGQGSRSGSFGGRPTPPAPRQP